jgi:adenine-specific DNA-methyltransferase
MNIATIDEIRLDINTKLDPKNKASLGQFMTPTAIADYMASLFDRRTTTVKLLDCGAGIGSLSVSAIKWLKKISSIDLWEIDPIMYSQLELNMKSMQIPYSIHTRDFIVESVENILNGSGERYTHAIINPPYKKINSDSEHRKELRKVGIETVNLYSAFFALSILLLETNGQIVAIVPRSFCNGPYYKSFRELLLKQCAIEHIHVFESRDKAFKDDEVLQENIIIKLRKGVKQSDVEISRSNDHEFTDYKKRLVKFSEVVKTNDDEKFIHIPIDASTKIEYSTLFSTSLNDLGISVSTGPVVSHRVEDFLSPNLTDNTVPMLYPNHFIGRKLHYPRVHKKANAIRVAPETKKLLMPNDGHYVIVKRFSTKEEKRRVVAYIVSPNELENELIGFDNGWNVFHVNKHGLDQLSAYGIACFLNSTALDEHFRVFSGHTQVNATDLKNMRYPNLDYLQNLGKSYKITMNQMEIDNLLEAAK